MLAGTHYETVELPEGFRQEKGTPIHLISTIGTLAIPRETVIKRSYILQVDLVAEVKFEDSKYVVVDYQVDEYGIGDSLQEAEQDLLDSLVDYFASLEKRERRLSDRDLRNLQLLRNMLARRNEL